MLAKKPKYTHLIPLSIFTVLTVVLIFIEENIAHQPDLLFMIIFLMLFFLVSELVSNYAGVFLTAVALSAQLFFKVFLNSNSTFTQIFLIITIVAYYFVIKKFRKKRLEETSAREKYFRTLANISLQPMILKNKNGKVLFASESITKILGLKKSIPMGEDLSSYIYHADLPIYKEFFKEVLKTPNYKIGAEFRFKKSDNEWIWVKNEAINLLGQNPVNAIVASLQDITFQKNADREKTEILENEKNARSLAEKAVKDRDEFMSIASHELKTPLTTILLQLQSTLRKISTQSLADFSGGELLNSLQIAEKQSKSLSILIKDLLNVSLASTGRLTLNKEKFNLSDLVDALPTRYSEEIRLSGNPVQALIKNKEIIGNWDPVRIDQAVTNLLTNALKYGQGKKITLTASKNDKFATFSIQDHGLGIDKSLHMSIFEPFTRVSENPNIRGLGVGLFIARQIAYAHGGDLTVESEVGKGSTFTLKLPL